VRESAGGSVHLPCRQGEETVGATRGRCVFLPCRECRVPTAAIRRSKAPKGSDFPAKARNLGQSRSQQTEMARYFYYEELIDGLELQGARTPFWAIPERLVPSSARSRWFACRWVGPSRLAKSCRGRRLGRRPIGRKKQADGQRPGRSRAPSARALGWPKRNPINTTVKRRADLGLNRNPYAGTNECE
jgi:hypothetical protein